MFERHSIKDSSQKGSTSSSLQKIVVDLDEQQEDSISGGSIQRLQEEFVPELGVIKGTLILTLM